MTTIHRLPARAATTPSAARIVAVAGLAAVAAVHVPVAAEHAGEARYLALLFDALVLTGAVLAGSLVTTDVPALWTAALALCVAAIAGYAVSRTVGLPLAQDDVGDWVDPRGVLAVALESAVAVAVVLHLLARRT